MDTKEPEYKVTLNYSETPTYMDGFADGYSRAWQECWERMRQIAQEECLKEEPKP